MAKKTWHDKHVESLTFGEKISDAVANGMGSWKFIIWQSIFVVCWMTLNVIGFIIFIIFIVLVLFFIYMMGK